MEKRQAALSSGHKGIPKIPWVEFMPGPWPLPFRTKEGKDEGQQQGRDPAQEQVGETMELP